MQNGQLENAQNQKYSEFLNDEYLKLHVAKEDLFWSNYMDLKGKNPEAFEKAEVAIKNYISDPKNILRVKEALQKVSVADAHEKKTLEGWLMFFECNAIENPRASQMQEELIKMESELFQKRAQVKMTYRDSSGKEFPGSTNVLSTNIAASSDETTRKTSHEALCQLESWVLANGFLDIVKKRNEFAQTLGYPNYFAYRVKKNEQMSVDELFEILNEFEELTREKCFSEIEKLKKEKGDSAALPYNIKYMASGDSKREIDPYLPFEKSLENWMLSFDRLRIDYRGAELTLDLFDRKGKYENGFMHAPMPSYAGPKGWVPARINFTSNATPSQVGSGQDGLFTLFHEGGHAAHFANVDMPGACYSQENPPTSMAYAETQSMFLDSLVADADWMILYAKDTKGNPVPENLVKQAQSARHPWSALAERSILLVAVFERKLYEMSDAERTPEAVLKLVRQVEKDILGAVSPRPVLAIPHLLSDSSACSYYGYLLAHMAVYQTRSHFLDKYGYLTDNPHIGPDLTEKYWKPGNSLSHKQTIFNLTGKKLSGRELAAYCNLSNEDLWKKSKAQIEKAKQNSAGRKNDHVPSLNARIRVIHGDDVIATSDASISELLASFERWVVKNYRQN